MAKTQAGAMPGGQMRTTFVNTAGRPFGCHPKGCGEPSAFFFQALSPQQDSSRSLSHCDLALLLRARKCGKWWVALSRGGIVFAKTPPVWELRASAADFHPAAPQKVLSLPSINPDLRRPPQSCGVTLRGSLTEIWPHGILLFWED